MTSAPSTLALALGIAATPELDAAWTEICARAAGRLSSLNVADPRIAQHVAGLLAGGGIAMSPEAILALDPDVIIAAAALTGDPAALREVDRIIGQAARRAALPEVPADEIGPEVRAILLVRDEDDAPPRLMRYSGKGSLAGWVGVVVARTAISVQRRARRGGMRSAGEEPLAFVKDGGSDPEIAALRTAYAGPFKVAFEQALRTLDAEEREILRLHVVEGHGLDRLAPVLGVHRATAARKLARAKDKVLEATKELLRQQAGIQDSEFDSLAGVLLSGTDVHASFLR